MTTDFSSRSGFKSQIDNYEDDKNNLQQMGSEVLIDYLKSVMEMIVNQKVEEGQVSKKIIPSTLNSYINSSRGGEAHVDDNDSL